MSNLGKAQCAIWGTPADAQGGTGDWTEYTSQRAGGTYQITRSAEATLQNSESGEKVYLTDLVLLANLNGVVPRITSADVGQASSFQNTSVGERYNRFLKVLQSFYPAVGQTFTFNELWHEGRDAKLAAAFMLPDTLEGNYSEPLIWFLAAAKEKHHLKASPTHDYSITVSGWEYIETLGVSLSPSDQIFVAMWFAGVEQRQLYDSGIKPAIERAGYNSVRIDDTHHNDKIDDQIIAEIRKSKAIIADLTCGLSKPIDWSSSENVGSPRGGVFFEAGFAKGLGLPVIWTVKSAVADVENVVHFDVRQFNQIRWDSNIAEFTERLQLRIEATLGRGPKRA